MKKLRPPYDLTVMAWRSWDGRKNMCSWDGSTYSVLLTMKRGLSPGITKTPDEDIVEASLIEKEDDFKSLCKHLQVDQYTATVGLNKSIAKAVFSLYERNEILERSE